MNFERQKRKEQWEMGSTFTVNRGESGAETTGKAAMKRSDKLARQFPIPSLNHTKKLPPPLLLFSQATEASHRLPAICSPGKAASPSPARASRKRVNFSPMIE